MYLVHSLLSTKMFFFCSLGGENLVTARLTYCVMWFKPTELNTVFGFTLSAALVVSGTNSMKNLINESTKVHNARHAVQATCIYNVLHTYTKSESKGFTTAALNCKVGTFVVLQEYSYKLNHACRAESSVKNQL